jgi:hypothetical protein
MAKIEKNSQKNEGSESNFERVGEFLESDLGMEILCYNGGNGAKPDKANQKTYNIEDYLINFESKIKDDIITVRIDETPIGVAGELTLINGQSKTGKSKSFVPNVIASSYLDQDTTIDTLGIKSVHNEGKPIIYIDTEMTRASTFKIFNTACKMAKIRTSPDNLFSLNIKSIPHLEKREASYILIDSIIKKAGKNPFMIIVDGLADFVIDPNNAIDCFAFLDELMIKAEKYECAIFGFLHMNPSSDKMRGHLGSHSERKAGAIISVEKKNNIHYIRPQFIRHGKDFEPIPFQWNSEEERFMSMTGTEAETAKKRVTDTNFNKNFVYVKMIQEIIRITSQTHFTHTELTSKIMLHHNKNPKLKTAQKYISEMKTAEIILLNENKEYYINPSAELIYST